MLIVIPCNRRRSRILDIKTLEEDPGAAQEFARSKASARKEGLTGVEFKDIAGLDPILGEVLEVRQVFRVSSFGGFSGTRFRSCSHTARPPRARRA